MSKPSAMIRPRMLPRTLLVALLVARALTSGHAGAADEGPALSVDPALLSASLRCPGTFAHPQRPAVLLVHGTFANPEENFGWNYVRGLAAAGFDVCTVRLPNRSLDDIQIAAEYVVYAVRQMHERTGATVSMIGHSQGGLEPRWALRWWPDVLDAVDDVVMLASPNHGTMLAGNGPGPLGCFPSCWQMTPGSMFLTALNAGDETPGDVSYTSLYSLTDELVQPAYPEATAALDGGRNILMQDVCPGRPVEHAGFAADGVAFDLAIDALSHPGPADPSRLPATACAQATFAAVDPVTMLTIGVSEFQTERPPSLSYSDHEPPLQPYASGAGA